MAYALEELAARRAYVPNLNALHKVLAELVKGEVVGAWRRGKGASWRK